MQASLQRCEAIIAMTTGTRTRRPKVMRFGKLPKFRKGIRTDNS
jgi:hypothetical protein